MLGGAFLVVAFIEIGSHAFGNPGDLSHFETRGFCGIRHNRQLAVDSSPTQKQRGPSSNLFDELTHHAVILNDLTFPSMSISYWTGESTESVVRPLSGELTPPFHPPKLV
jgi:hypothetical protein